MQLSAGDLAAAKQSYGALSKVEGAAGAARLGQARLAREAGRPEVALTLLAEADDPRASLERAQVLEALGRAQETETTWKRVALSDDREQRSAGVVGLARVRLGRDDARGALEALYALLDQDPGYALTWAQVRGEALLVLGRLPEARALYAGLNADAEARVVGLLGQAEVELWEDAPPRRWSVSGGPSRRARTPGTRRWPEGGNRPRPRGGGGPRGGARGVGGPGVGLPRAGGRAGGAGAAVRVSR